MSVHLPLLVMISGSSAKAPTQTSPKFPLSAMIRFALGAGARSRRGRFHNRLLAPERAPDTLDYIRYANPTDFAVIHLIPNENDCDLPREAGAAPKPGTPKVPRPLRAPAQKEFRLYLFAY